MNKMYFKYLYFFNLNKFDKKIYEFDGNKCNEKYVNFLLLLIF